MKAFVESVGAWFVDYYLLATLLLAVSLIAMALMRQPVRKLALVRASFAGLLLLAALCALPSWSMIHLGERESLSAAGQRPGTSGAYSNPVIGAGPAGAATGPESPARISEPVGAGGETVSPEVVTAADLQGEPAMSAPSFSVVGWAYLAGLGLVALWLGVGVLRVGQLCREAEPAPENVQTLFERLAGAMALLPRLLVTERLPSAVALGLREPKILLPKTLAEEAEADALSMVLAHEWAHVRNGDLRLLAVGRMLMLLLWAHPLYWMLRVRLRLEQETLADADAAELTDRHDYAEQLVAWARTMPAGSHQRIASAVGIWEGPTQLRRRIGLLLDEKLTVLRACSRAWRLMAGAVCVVLAVGLSLVTLTPADADEEGQEGPASVEKVVKESPSGEKVRVLAIGTHNEDPQQWWGPQGETLEKMPLQVTRLRSYEREGMVIRELIWHLQDVPAGASTVSELSPINGRAGGGGGHVLVDGEPSPRGFRACTFRTDESERHVNLRVGVAAGPWRTLAKTNTIPERSSTFPDTSTHYVDGKAYHISFAGIYTKDGGGVTITNDDLGTSKAIRVIAIDKLGSPHPSTRYQRSTFYPFGHQTEWRFGELPADKIVRFEFQTRDYEWAEFENLPLHPDLSAQPQRFELPPPAPKREVLDQERKSEVKGETATDGHGEGTAAHRDSPGDRLAAATLETHRAEAQKRRLKKSSPAERRAWYSTQLIKLRVALDQAKDPGLRNSIAISALGYANSLDEHEISASLVEEIIKHSRDSLDIGKWHAELAEVYARWARSDKEPLEKLAKSSSAYANAIKSIGLAEDRLSPYAFRRLVPSYAGHGKVVARQYEFSKDASHKEGAIAAYRAGKKSLAELRKLSASGKKWESASRRWTNGHGDEITYTKVLEELLFLGYDEQWFTTQEKPLSNAP